MASTRELIYQTQCIIIRRHDNNIILYDELIYFKKLNQDYNYIRDNFSWRIVYYNVNKRKDNKIGIITNNITGQKIN